MKTTLDLNDALLVDAKAMAAQQRTTLTRIVEDGLRLRLATAKTVRNRKRVVLPVFAGRGGLAPGIDPGSNRSLLAAADGDDT